MRRLTLMVSATTALPSFELVRTFLPSRMVSAISTTCAAMKSACLSLARAYGWRKSSPHLVDGAGHWVQQEQPERVSELLLQFLRDSAKS